MRLGAHLLPPDDGEIPVWDFGRGELDADIPPGGETVTDIALRAPEQPGAYEVEFDMVAEGVAWFEDRGSPVIRRALRVDVGSEGS